MLYSLFIWGDICDEISIWVLAATLIRYQHGSRKPIWQDFSITGLYGENYEVVDKEETTVTLEYAAKVKYADVFLFHGSHARR
jgi:hypothetical protein